LVPLSRAVATPKLDAGDSGYDDRNDSRLANPSGGLDHQAAIIAAQQHGGVAGKEAWSDRALHPGEATAILS